MHIFDKIRLVKVVLQWSQSPTCFGGQPPFNFGSPTPTNPTSHLFLSQPPTSHQVYELPPTSPHTPVWVVVWRVSHTTHGFVRTRYFGRTELFPNPLKLSFLWMYLYMHCTCIVPIHALTTHEECPHVHGFIAMFQYPGYFIRAILGNYELFLTKPFHCLQSETALLMVKRESILGKLYQKGAIYH